MIDKNAEKYIQILIAMALPMLGLAVYAESVQVSDLTMLVQGSRVRINALEQRRTMSGKTMAVNVGSADTNETGVDLTTVSVSWKGSSYRFIHRCLGKAAATAESAPGTPSYCLGENELVLMDAKRKETVLDETEFVNPSGLLTLVDATLVPSATNAGDVLVSYTPNFCNELGCDQNFVTLLVNLKTRQVRPLLHFPERGKAVWNPEGTKALFTPNTCGGAGCTEEAMIGYDLTKDTQKTVTKERAVGEFVPVPDASAALSCPKDVSGNNLDYWQNVQWKDNITATATIVHPDNTRKTITVTF